MASLDATQQNKLESDPSNPNPNAQKKAAPAAPRPGLGFSKSTNGPPKPSLKDFKKAALAAKAQPPRPGSAMSSFSPVRNVSTVSTSTNGDFVRSRPESATSMTSMTDGGLSVAPKRPTRFKPRPEIVRPATAGPYSSRRPGQAGTENTTSPSSVRPRLITSATSTTPKKPLARPGTSHSSHASQSSIHASPARDKGPSVRPPSTNSTPVREKGPLARTAASEQASPASHVRSRTMQETIARVPSPSKADEELTMVIPSMTQLGEPFSSPRASARMPDVDDITTPMKSLKVYEDPSSSTDDKTTAKPTFEIPVLEEMAINEDAFILNRNVVTPDSAKNGSVSPERTKNNVRLLDSGITRVQAKSLDVHGLRKLQSLIKDGKTTISDEKFDTLLLGLFEYLELSMPSLPAEKVQDVKAQVLVTVRLMLKKDRESFKSHVPRALLSLLETRSRYDARAHIVIGLEGLADELVLLADPAETLDTLIALLQNEGMTQEGCRTLSLGMHVLKSLLATATSFVPSENEVSDMSRLALRCLDSSESGVRMDAVQLCVALHAKIGDSWFWKALDGVRDDPRNLITYYIVKRERDNAVA